MDIASYMNYQLTNTDFLIEDILRVIEQGDTKHDLATLLNNHLVSKEAIRNVFTTEIAKAKPDWKVLSGAIRTFIAFLAYKPRIAFYEIIEVVEALKHSFLHDKRKTVRTLSHEAILRLFITLYIEYYFVFISDRDQDIIARFKKSFAKKEFIEIIMEYSRPLSFIFDQYGLKPCYGNECKIKLLEFTEKFYSK